jgi:acetyl esterase/lipase
VKIQENDSRWHPGGSAKRAGPMERFVRYSQHNLVRDYDGAMMRMKRFVRVGGMAFGLIAMTALGQSANGHLTVRLWANSAPDSQGSTPETMRVAPEGDHVITHVDQPSITVYLPNADKATGAAVVVIPGGGHSELWIDHEGHAVAEYLSSHGVAAFVLKYRLAREKGSRYTVEGTELGDVQRAIRTVRSRSEEWGLDTARIGVIGFSAGGELAALASTRSDSGKPDAADAVDHVSSRPDFQALIYPGLPHESRLTADTPRAFLACGAMDQARISQGLAEYYLALARLKVPTELHIYAGTGHGFGIRSSNPKPVADWPELFLDWMATEKLLRHT